MESCRRTNQSHGCTMEGFYIPPGLGKPPPGSAGSGSEGWGHLGSLGLQAATIVHRWLKARNEWIMMGNMSVYWMYLPFALQPVFMLNTGISKVITNSKYIHGFARTSNPKSDQLLHSQVKQPHQMCRGCESVSLRRQNVADTGECLCI